MDTLITRFPVAFTNAAALPVIVPAPASAGVNTYDNRWIVSRSSSTHGAPIGELANLLPAAPALVQGSATLRPLAQVSGDEKWMKFDGVDDYIGLGAFVRSAPYSVALVARIRSTASKTAVKLSTGSPTVQVVTTGGAAPVTDMRATATLKLTGTNAANGAWHVIIASFAGADSVIAMDATTATGDTGAAPATVFSLGDSAVGGVGFADYDVAEVITWPHALTAAQALTVRSALAAAHPALF